MLDAHVIETTDPLKRLALMTADGRCAVFSCVSGPRLEVGDVLAGPVLEHGKVRLVHESGMFDAVGETGPLDLEGALVAFLHHSK